MSAVATLDEQVNDLVTRVEFGNEQFQLGFVFCESLKLLREFEAKVAAALAQNPVTQSIQSARWRAPTESEFAAAGLAFLRANSDQSALYWLDLHAGNELEVRKLLVLLNERRGELVASLQGLLVIAMRNSFGGEVRSLVPDLWSVRSVSITLRPRFVFDRVEDEVRATVSITTAPAALAPDVHLRVATEKSLRNRDPIGAIEIATSVFESMRNESADYAVKWVDLAGTILDDVLAYEAAAAAFEWLLDHTNSDSAAVSQPDSACRWARKWAENLLGSGLYARALEVVSKYEASATRANKSDKVLFSQVRGEALLATGDWIYADAFLRAALSSADEGSNAQVRALAALAELYARRNDIRAAYRYAEDALEKSTARIERLGLSPARALRHAKLMTLRRRIEDLRGDRVVDWHSIDEFLARAITEFGPVPVIVQYRAAVAHAMARSVQSL